MTFRRIAFRLCLMLVAPALCCVSLLGAQPNPAAGAGDMPVPRDFTYRQRQLDRTREGLELYRKRVSIPDAARPDAALAAWLRKPSIRSQPSIRFDSPTTGLFGLLQSGLIAAAMILTALQCNRKFGARFANFAGATFWPSEAGADGDLSAKVRAEEAAFSEFVSNFRVGLTKPAGHGSGALKDADGLGTQPLSATGGAGASMKEFIEWAPVQVAKLKAVLQQLSRSTADSERQAPLDELAGLVQTFQGRVELPELLSVRQVAAALAGLLQQFIQRKNTITPSTLRTVASALDLLGDLCQGGWNANFTPLPEVKLLVVDDDLISRRAVSFALKRTFSQPDLAQSGEAALPLAEKQRYDMIFLDVQMPGMDGFEVCSKIHATEANRSTPVVFVTCHSDFQARTKAIISGGNDLIAKPFLSFELALKALVSLLRARLQEAKSGADAASTQPSQAVPTKSVESLSKNSNEKTAGRAQRRGGKRIAQRRMGQWDVRANPSFRGERQCQAL